MKVCTCQFCGTITKFDWSVGKLPLCPACQGVLDINNVYEEDEFEEIQEENNNDEHVVKCYKDDSTMTNVIALIATAIVLFMIGSIVWFIKKDEPRYNYRGKEVRTTEITYETEINGELTTLVDTVEYEVFDEEKFELVGNLCEDENGNITATYALVERTNY